METLERNSLKFGVKYKSIFINDINFTDIYLEPEKVKEDLTVIHIHNFNTKEVIAAMDLENFRKLNILN